MKNNLFYARPDTCRKALKANKQSRFPVKGLLSMGEWVEQRRDGREKIKNIMRQSTEAEVPKPIAIKKRVILCNLNDYP